MSDSLEQYCEIRKLGPHDLDMMEDLLSVFGAAFQDKETYCEARPAETYITSLLGSDFLIVLTALREGEVVGGIAAYELPKFEQERKELYIYDLAVALEHRRQGVATALIEEMRRIAFLRGSHVLFVQADHGDEPAIALYTKLGKREDVHHFDIQPIGK